MQINFYQRRYKNFKFCSNISFPWSLETLIQSRCRYKFISLVESNHTTKLSFFLILARSAILRDCSVIPNSPVCYLERSHFFSRHFCQRFVSIQIWAATRRWSGKSKKAFPHVFFRCRFRAVGYDCCRRFSAIYVAEKLSSEVVLTYCAGFLDVWHSINCLSVVLCRWFH